MELPMKLGLSGVAMFFFGISFGFVIFPPFLKWQVGEAVILKQGADMRNMWAKLPFPLEFKIYLFNVTNPAGIMKGDKPVIHEVGPFFYDEWKEKVDLEDREEDDTVEYSQRTTWIFNPSKSNGLTGNEVFVFPNVPMLSIVMTVLRTRPNLIRLAAKAIESIFKNPNSTFVEATAHDILFGGLTIDCNFDVKQDFAASSVCSLLKDSPNLETIGKDLYKISVFGHRNGTLDEDRLRVKRGIKNTKDLGKVISFKGETQLSNWPEGSRCNEFNGTDSTIFHPYLFQDEDVVSFTPELCRSIGARWDGTRTSVKGIAANHYTAEFGDMSTDPNLKCFCPTEETCLKKGLFDLFNCIDTPIVASLPHFYKVDKSYLKQVIGLKPDKEKHQLDVDFEPMTGTPMSARKRLQFNMFVHADERVRTMKNFPTALLPLFWVEEGVTLGDDILAPVRMVFTMLTLVNITKWGMMIMGMVLVGTGAGLHYKRRQSKQNLDITKISTR